MLRLVSLAAVVVWGTFLLDWSLELPRAIRALHIAVAVLLLLTGLRLFFFSPRRRLSEGQLAASVEDADGRLEQSLITAVQLTAPENPRAAFYSPTLLARTVAEAEARVADLRPRELLSRQGVFLSLLVVLGLLSPLIAGAAWRSDLARVYVHRNLWLSNQPWPREYYLEIEKPSEVETLVAMGDTFSVLVRKVRGGDARVLLRTVYDNGEREVFPLERGAEVLEGDRQLGPRVLRLPLVDGHP